MDAGNREHALIGEHEQAEDFGKTWKAKTALISALLLGVGTGLALGIDGPLARWLQPPPETPSPETPPQARGKSSALPPETRGGKLPKDLKRVLAWSEGFGHGLGVVLLGLVIYQLDPPNRRRLVRALCMALASGLVADGMKLLVGRTRPRAFDLGQPILESFTGFLPGLSGGSGGQSFPSAHVGTAVGWALGLGWLYPRGKWIFVFFAFLVLCQRLEANAHFLSDCLAGAAVGCLVSSLFLPGGWLSKIFQRWENAAGGPPSANPCFQQPSG